jgi:hypothetical protein
VRASAEEFSQAVVAEDWAVAHNLFASQLAPRWWAANNMERLRAALACLDDSGSAVEAAVGAAAWNAGAGLNRAYLRLQVRTGLPSCHMQDTIPCRAGLCRPWQ